ncbi:MAG TPA: sigma-70 family RNA polymerase sigma factor [Isosphaeraceae bacterium]|nr:sigma-70 family RNA polymerase sigma factor [Isosphaeraceae bacterium]
MADDGDELALRLESFRNYLLLLARVQIDGRLRGKLDPDDLVQQTLTRALEKRDRFRGTDDAQRAAWLRTLLSHTMIDAVRKLARSGPAERSLEAAIEQSSARLDALLAADQTSPSGRFDRQERLRRLADALAALPDDQRLAVELKHLQGLALVEMARRMDRSVPAVAGLLHRGLKALREDLGES